MAAKERKVTIHVVRHAQAQHNIRYDPELSKILNPTLTPHGIKQCARLRSTFPHMDKINIVLCSPLKRTLETALHGFAPLFQRGLKAILWSELVEWGLCPCNDYGDWQDFSTAVPDLDKNLDLMKKALDLSFEERVRDRMSRVLRVKRDLHALAVAMQTEDGVWYDIPVGKLAKGNGDIEILIISHGGFLQSLGGPAKSLHNTQYRSYELANFDNNVVSHIAPFELVETKESRENVFRRLRPKDHRYQRYPGFDNVLSIEERMAQLPRYALDLRTIEAMEKDRKLTTYTLRK